MRNDDMLDLDNHAYLVHNHHRDHMYNSRRDPRNRLCMYSRNRNRRT